MHNRLHTRSLPRLALPVHVPMRVDPRLYRADNAKNNQTRILAMRMFLRMSKWARNPPSAKRVKLVFGIVAVCLMIALIEWLGLWPDWATTQKARFR